MNYAAGLMIRRGGDYEPHGREMRGAARIIEGWLNEIGMETMEDSDRITFFDLAVALSDLADLARHNSVVAISFCPLTESVPSIHVRSLSDLEQLAVGGRITTSRHSETSTKAEAMVDGVRVFTILIDEPNKEV